VVIAGGDPTGVSALVEVCDGSLVIAGQAEAAKKQGELAH
jgi:hypothetical protein